MVITMRDIPISSVYAPWLLRESTSSTRPTSLLRSTTRSRSPPLRRTLRLDLIPSASYRARRLEGIEERLKIAGITTAKEVISVHPELPAKSSDPAIRTARTNARQTGSGDAKCHPCEYSTVISHPTNSQNTINGILRWCLVAWTVA